MAGGQLYNGRGAAEGVDFGAQLLEANFFDAKGAEKSRPTRDGLRFLAGLLRPLLLVVKRSA